MSRRIDFRNVAPAANNEPLRIGPLRFTGPTKNGDVEFDFTVLRGTRLQRDLVIAFQDTLQYLRITSGQARRTQRDLISFCQHLQAENPKVTCARELSWDILDSWVNLIMPQGPASGWGCYDTCMDVFAVMKNLPEGMLSNETKLRLRYVHPQGAPARTPKDAYSQHVIAQLVTACRERIPLIVKRLTVDAATLVAAGRDPRGDDATEWTIKANQAWLADKVGPLNHREHITESRRYNTGKHGLNVSVKVINAALFPSQADLIPFYILFTIETGWPPAVVTEMTTDCRSNLTKDHVTLTSKKYRAGHKIVSERFRGNGYFSPGGIVAQVIAIGERLRRVAGRKELWLVQQDQRIHLAKFRSATGEALSRFLEEIDLRDDDDVPIRGLKLISIRKAHKARWYQQTLGQLDRFARNDHTISVAAKHYGNIPALRELHEDTIAQGQQAALEAVTHSQISSSVVPQDIACDIGVPLEEASTLSAGTRDMWVSACRNPHDSPFDVSGKLCTARPGRCFGCRNAVILGRHLPRVLAYRQWMLQERDNMSEADWNTLHGLAYLLIGRDILTRFPENMLAQAQAVAAVDHGVPLLPPAIILQGTLT